MIEDILIPVLQKRFPGKSIVTGGKDPEPFIIFPAIHPDVGDIELIDEGGEITLIAGNFTHGHFSNFDDIPEKDKEIRISEKVTAFLERLFADEIILFGSHKGSGGWESFDPGSPRTPQENEHLWS